MHISRRAERHWKHLNATILRMKIKQLVIFTILNDIFENIYTILKTELYDHDKKLFYMRSCTLRL